MLYGLRVQISIGENLLTGLAEATACLAAALPEPMIPKITSERIDKTNKEIEEIERLDKVLAEEMSKNKKFFNLNTSTKPNGHNAKSNLMNNSKNEAADLGVLLNDQKTIFKIELDDIKENDEIHLLFDDMNKKKGVYACSTEYLPGISRFNENIQMFTSVYRCETSLNQMNTSKFNEINEEILNSLQYKFRRTPFYCLANLSFDVSLFDDDHAMIIITGCCLTFSQTELGGAGLITKLNINSSDLPSGLSIQNKAKSKEKTHVEITNLSYVPNALIEHYFGHVNLFLIRESTQIKENGGLSGFMHCFITEVLALSRAHVLSLGGNALVSFKMNECILLDNPHRNQGQCLINVSGDAVKVHPKQSQ